MTQDVQDALDTGALIMQIDDARPADDPFKLKPVLRQLVETRHADLDARDKATELAEGDRGGAAANGRAALDALETLLRDGFKHINGLPSYAITAADRRQFFLSHGWESENLGDFDDPRVLHLATLAVNAAATISDPNRRYPTELMIRISAQLAIHRATAPLATGGTRQTATKARDEALRLMQKAISRARNAYSSDSDDLDQTPELRKIGLQPRRDRGTASSPTSPQTTPPPN